MRLSTVLRYMNDVAMRFLLSCDSYNWHVFTRRLSRRLLDTVSASYTHDGDVHDASIASDKDARPVVVFVCNGNNESGGWADRLKGMLSTFSVCRQLGLDFRIFFTSPFHLDSFLLPADYDWRIDPKDVVFAMPHTDIVALEIGSESAYQARRQREWLTRRLASSQARQIHVYTNAMFAYDDDFSALFSTLFRFSPRLEEALKREQQMLGRHYVSVSARFVEALGDFTDTQKGEPLPEDKRERLLDACMAQLHDIHRRHPSCKILVGSDSSTFLRRAKALDFTYVVNGGILHLDVPSATSGEEVDEYERFEKMFLDFFLIARADRVYRLDGPWMHKSGFPVAASRVGGKEFSAIKFIPNRSLAF